MSPRVMLPLLLAALLLPALARADAVSALRATLGRMHATQPLAASLKVTSTVRAMTTRRRTRDCR